MTGLRVLCLLCLMQFSTSVLADEAWQAPDFIVQAFEEVALKNEYNAGEQVVRKWQQPIKVWVTHHTDRKEMHDWLVEQHLKHLSQMTGVPVQKAAFPSEANFTIVFTHLQLWRNEIVLQTGNLTFKPPNHAICMFGIDLDKKKAIRRAWVVIPVDQAEQHRHLLSCVVEEMTQAMGLPNDSVKVYPSIFNDASMDQLLTGLDSLLLKLLYDPRVQAGMTANQVRPVLYSIIRGWQADGTITQAEKNVRQSELYDMMGF